MKNVDYAKLTKQTYLSKEQLDIILAPYKEDIENGTYIVIFSEKEAERNDIDYLIVEEYIAELEKTLLMKQDGNPCFMCHSSCDYCYPVDYCYDSQETEEELCRLTDRELKEVVEETQY